VSTVNSTSRGQGLRPCTRPLTKSRGQGLRPCTRLLRMFLIGRVLSRIESRPRECGAAEGRARLRVEEPKGTNEPEEIRTRVVSHRDGCHGRSRPRARPPARGSRGRERLSTRWRRRAAFPLDVRDRRDGASSRAGMASSPRSASEASSPPPSRTARRNGARRRSPRRASRRREERTRGRRSSSGKRRLQDGGRQSLCGGVPGGWVCVGFGAPAEGGASSW
jgi:hypothetical protein